MIHVLLYMHVYGPWPIDVLNGDFPCVILTIVAMPFDTNSSRVHREVICKALKLALLYILISSYNIGHTCIVVFHCSPFLQEGEC